MPDAEGLPVVAKGIEGPRTMRGRTAAANAESADAERLRTKSRRGTAANEERMPILACARSAKSEPGGFAFSGTSLRGSGVHYATGLPGAH